MGHGDLFDVASHAFAAQPFWVIKEIAEGPRKHGTRREAKIKLERERKRPLAR
jgi:hypothetical protein